MAASDLYMVNNALRTKTLGLMGACRAGPSTWFPGKSYSGFPDQSRGPGVTRQRDQPAWEELKLLISKIISAALIALAILGFVAKERWNVRNPDADRTRHQCEKQNITEFQVHECRIRMTMQTRHGDQFSQLDIRR
jgi:hypothetical protein